MKVPPNPTSRSRPGGKSAQVPHKTPLSTYPVKVRVRAGAKGRSRSTSKRNDNNMGG